MIFKESESERRKNTPVIEPPITEEMVTLRCTLQNVKPPQSVLSAENTDMHRASEGLLPPTPPAAAAAAAESTGQSVTARQSTCCGENDTHLAARQPSCEAGRAPIGCRRTRDRCLEEAVGSF